MENVRLQQLLKLINNNSDDPFILFALAQEYKKQGDFSTALNYFETIIAKHPNYTGAYLHFGQLLEQTGNAAQAKQVFQKGIDICTRLEQWHDRNELMSALG